LGKAFGDLEIEDRVLTGLFLCSNSPNEILQELKPGWNEKVGLSIEEKYLLLNTRPTEAQRRQDQYSIRDVFPWEKELSLTINFDKFCSSFFIQPRVYLRLRPGFEQTVKRKLSAAEIKFEEINSTCLAVQQGVKVENVIELDKEAVVQDLNSQGLRYFITFDDPSDGGPSDGSPGPPSDRPGSDWGTAKVWDCCAGSGGKSLLAYDLNPKINLTVSDTRESIIRNLKRRFDSAGIRKYKSFIADLSIADCQLPIANSNKGHFNLIICDAPCTGSGTWSRTPEQLYFFDSKKINEYSTLQKKIISNSITQLKEGGHFVYITCSVFKKENEDNVEFIQKNFAVEFIKSALLKGYDKKADSLFVAQFKKQPL